MRLLIITEFLQEKLHFWTFSLMSGLSSKWGVLGPQGAPIDAHFWINCDLSNSGKQLAGSEAEPRVQIFPNRICEEHQMLQKVFNNSAVKSFAYKECRWPLAAFLCIQLSFTRYYFPTELMWFSTVSLELTHSFLGGITSLRHCWLRLLPQSKAFPYKTGVWTQTRRNPPQTTAHSASRLKSHSTHSSKRSVAGGSGV